MKKPRFKYYNPGFEEIKPEPIYMLWTEGMKGDNDVCGQTLIDAGFPIPPTPAYETWCQLVRTKQKCGRCFATVRGQADLEQHNRQNHMGAKAYVPA